MSHDMMLYFHAKEVENVHTVSITLEDCTFSVDKYILSSAGEKLKELVNSNTNIKLEDTDPFTFEQFLLWIYTGNCTLRKSNKITHSNITTEVRNYENDELSSNNKYMKDDTPSGHVNISYPLLQLAKQYNITNLEYKLSQVIKEKSKHDYDRDIDEMLIAEHRTFDRLAHKEFYNVKVISKSGDTLSAHGCVLAARDDYFRSLFSLRWNNVSVQFLYYQCTNN